MNFKRSNFPLVGKKVYIKKFTKKNLTKKYFNWFKEKKNLKYSRHKNREYKYIDFINYYQSFKKNKNLFFSVYDKKNNSFIGTMTAYTNLKNKTADIGILIGEKKFLGKGFGADAWKTLISYLFKFKRLNEITAGTKSKNLQMIKVFKIGGMKLYKQNKKQKSKIFKILNVRKI